MASEKMEKISFLYLSNEDVFTAGLSMAEAIDQCNLSLKEYACGHVENPPKPGIHPTPESFIHAMPSYVKGLDAGGMKWVSGFPENVPRGIPTIVGLIVMNDMETGYPRAILDGTYITAIRTAAASGVSVKHLARPDSEELAIVGAGVQGQYHTLCMLHLLKNLKRIKVYDIYKPSVQRYLEAVKTYTDKKNVEVEIVSSFEEAITGSDVIVCATGTLHDTVMFDEWMKKGALLLPVHRRGWNTNILANVDKCVVDDYDQFVYHERQTFDPLPDTDTLVLLEDIVVGKKSGRQSDDERIVCYNVGLGMYDVVIASKIVEKAKAKGLGKELTLMDLTKRPPLPPID